ncbi:MAG: hypothetical protein ACM3NO_03020 [Deltaproteobacteria bacterium]
MIFLSCANPAGATALAAIRTSKAIVIAMDSQLSALDGSSIGTYCKIREYGLFTVALTGLAFDRESGFDAFEIARASLSTGPEDKALAGFLQQMTKGLLSVAEWDTAHNRDNSSLNRKGRYILSAVVAWRQSRTLKMHAYNFSIVKEASQELRVHAAVQRCPGDCKDGMTLYLGGPHMVNEDYYRQFPNKFQANPIPVLRGYVQLLIKKFPMDYSGPIAIIRIDRSGTSWVQDGVCRDSALRDGANSAF